MASHMATLALQGGGNAAWRKKPPPVRFDLDVCAFPLEG